jgi:hypothetical protein
MSIKFKTGLDKYSVNKNYLFFAHNVFGSIVIVVMCST